MGIIPTITCKKCGRKYSGLKGKCPHCGSGRVKLTSRTAATTAAAQPGTSANNRMRENAKWQAIFGVILLVAVIAAVIALIMLSLPDEGEQSVPSPDLSITPPPTPSPTPSPSPLPTQQVTGLTISYGNELRTEFAMNVGDRVPLSATVYPLEYEATASWRSANEDICTVDSDGVVTGVASGWSAVIAECGGMAAECRVWVR